MTPANSIPSDRYFCRLGGIAAFLGVPCVVVGTFAHPMTASPADAHAAFAEYAADRFWIASHLLQLLGVAFITASLMALSWKLRGGAAGVWAVLGSVAAIGALALSGALQAADGIALKTMVDRWASASPESQALLFEGAFAVRQVEIGLASIVILFFGLAAALYAGALWLDEHAPDWLGWLALLSGLAMLVAGLLYAYSGFSDRAMMVSMPASLLLMLWSLAVGAFLFRSSRLQPRSAQAPGDAHVRS